MHYVKLHLLDCFKMFCQVFVNGYILLSF